MRQIILTFSLVLSVCSVSTFASTDPNTASGSSAADATTSTQPKKESAVMILGDVNGNGSIDIGDAVSIVNYLVGKQSATFIEEAADTNNNNDIDIGDAVTIVNYLVGKPSALQTPTSSDQGIGYGGTDTGGGKTPSSRGLE